LLAFPADTQPTQQKQVLPPYADNPDATDRRGEVDTIPGREMAPATLVTHKYFFGEQ
jgi:hypothetical protein